MSTKPKCHLNLNVTKTDLSLKLKCHKKEDVTETEVSPKLKFHTHKILLRLIRHHN